MALALPITEVSFLAKELFCLYSGRALDYIFNKIRLHKKLTIDEAEKYEFIQKEILSIVNYKASIVSGLSKNNRQSAKLLYKNLVYVIIFDCGQGKVVTVQLDSASQHKRAR